MFQFVKAQFYASEKKRLDLESQLNMKKKASN
jgi:hypothetical protein